MAGLPKAEFSDVCRTNRVSSDYQKLAGVDKRRWPAKAAGRTMHTDAKAATGLAFFTSIWRPMIDQERLLARFLQYVRIDTTAREGQSTYPSSTGQLELGSLLRDQLLAMGVHDVGQTEFGIILATLPATANGGTSVVALNAHLDTSP